VLALLRSTNGQAEYKHHAGELSIVSTAVDDIDTKSVLIANLPPEVPDYALRAALAPFGTVMAIQEEFGRRPTAMQCRMEKVKSR